MAFTKRENPSETSDAEIEMQRERAREQRREREKREREERELQLLKDVDDGLGWSSDKTLARYYSTSRKTIWKWVSEGKLPEPQKISANMTRWKNSTVKAYHEKKFIGGLYG